MYELEDDAWMGDPCEEARCNDWSAIKNRTQSLAVPDPPTPQSAQADIPTADPLPAQETAKRFARVAGAVYTASVIATVMPGLDDAEVMMHYLNQMAVDANAQSDPLLRMLMDQIAIMFHRLGALHSSSANAKTPEAVVAYNAAAARLNTELRKSMLTLRELQAISMRGATYVKVVKSQVPSAPQSRDEKVVTELIGNSDAKPLKEESNETQNSNANPGEKFEASRSRAIKSAQESRPHDRGARETADHDTFKQTMAEINRACHAGW